MTTEELLALVKTRRSVRKWKKDPVPEEVLRKALETAVWSPNGGNFQTWRFYAVTNPDTIETMGRDVQEAADLISSWDEAAEHALAVECSKRHAASFRNAPAVIAVTTGAHLSSFDRVLLKRSEHDEQAVRILSRRRAAPTSVQSAAGAVMLLLLSLHQQGLGAVWLGAPLIAAQRIKERIGADPDSTLICLVAVGYPDEVPEKDRLPLDDVVTFLRPQDGAA